MRSLLNSKRSLCFSFENDQERVNRAFLVLINLKEEIKHDLVKEKGYTINTKTLQNQQRKKH